MPNCTVTRNANGSLSFDPDSIDMNAAGNITFTRAPGSSWTFSGFSCPSDPGDFSIVGTPGTTMVVRDAHANLGTFEYTVSISTGDESDPQIINKT